VAASSRGFECREIGARVGPIVWISCEKVTEKTLSDTKAPPTLFSPAARIECTHLAAQRRRRAPRLREPLSPRAFRPRLGREPVLHRGRPLPPVRHHPRRALRPRVRGVHRRPALRQNARPHPAHVRGRSGVSGMPGPPAARHLTIRSLLRVPQRTETIARIPIDGWPIHTRERRRRAPPVLREPVSEYRFERRIRGRTALRVGR